MYFILKENWKQFAAVYKHMLFRRIGQNISPQTLEHSSICSSGSKLLFERIHYRNLFDILCPPAKSPFSETEYVRAFIFLSHILYIKFRIIFSINIINVSYIIIYIIHHLYTIICWKFVFKLLHFIHYGIIFLYILNNTHNTHKSQSKGMTEIIRETKITMENNEQEDINNNNI